MTRGGPEGAGALSVGDRSTAASEKLHVLSEFFVTHLRSSFLLTLYFFLVFFAQPLLFLSIFYALLFVPVLVGGLPHLGFFSFLFPQPLFGSSVVVLHLHLRVKTFFVKSFDLPS